MTYASSRVTAWRSSLQTACLILEHGAEQQQAVAALLEAAGWVDIACHNDLAGKPRVTVARHNGK